MRANQVLVNEDLVVKALTRLRIVEDHLDAELARSILQSVVPGFRPNFKMVDFLVKKIV